MSLIEVLGVVTILAILVALVSPVTHSIINQSQRSKAALNMRSIAQAYVQFIQDSGKPVSVQEILSLNSKAKTPDINMLAAFFEKMGYCDDVSVWSWDFDPLMRKYLKNHTLPESFYDTETNSLNNSATGKCGGSGFPVSVACAVIQCENFDYRSLVSSKIPIVISRGLSSQGTWNLKNHSTQPGIWGNTGGLIAYANGNIEWVKNTSNYFNNFSNNNTTSNPNEALPNHQIYDENNEFNGSRFLDYTGFL